MKINKSKKGISLIVLVITIIVMIILAAAIILSLNSSGIIGKANQAEEDYSKAQYKEAASLAIAELELDGIEVTASNLETNLKEKFGNNVTVAEEGENYVITINGVAVTMPTNKTIAKVEGSSDDWEFDATTGTITKIKDNAIEENIVIPNYIDGVAVKKISTGENMNVIWSEKVKTITISKGIEEIGDYAFCDNQNLETVYIPEGVKHIGDNAFAWCYKLSSINIPTGVLTIGSWVFENCYPLTELYIPKSVQSIGTYAFGIGGYPEKMIITIQYGTTLTAGSDNYPWGATEVIFETAPKSE